MTTVDTIIVGAGPYGLSVAAHLRAANISHQIVGQPMESWRKHMPVGMALKSESLASNFSDPATKTKAANTLPGCSDCLICQLHQNFSASLISVPPSSGPSSAGSKSFHSTTVSVYSQASRPRAGRAPPLASF